MSFGMRHALALFSDARSRAINPPIRREHLTPHSSHEVLTLRQPVPSSRVWYPSRELKMTKIVIKPLDKKQTTGNSGPNGN
jgi:hypothetical protein